MPRHRSAAPPPGPASLRTCNRMRPRLQPYETAAATVGPASLRTSTRTSQSSAFSTTSGGEKLSSHGSRSRSSAPPRAPKTSDGGGAVPGEGTS
eukprot:scaffold63519_cov60-Phaeocystis_antarctica.AAC.2